MVKERGETSNQNQATEEVAGQLLGRPIGGVSEANCREICKMVDVRGETSNALFDTLEEWNDYLNKENIDPPKLSPNKLRLQNRGPRP